MRPSISAVGFVTALLALLGACESADHHGPSTATSSQPISPTTQAPSAGAAVAGMPAASPSTASGAAGAPVMMVSAPPAAVANAAGTGAAPTTGAAGAPAATGVIAGAGEVGAAGAAAPPARADLGKGDGQDVVTIGDSYMRLNNEGVEPSLDRITSVVYRHHAVMGTQLSSGQIPSQYDDAKAQNPDIKTVVMTGGGNDFLQDFAASSDCPDIGPNCSVVLEAIRETMIEMWAEMAVDGVQDVFLLTYPPTPMTNLGPAFEFIYEKIEQDCATAPLMCHFVNATPAFEGRTRELIRGDNIHPTGEGYDILAKLVWDAMEAAGARR
jgi:lysophospholipase L1-like esterase